MKKRKIESNFFEIVAWNLVKHFEYDEYSANEKIEDFRKNNKKDDGFYYRYGSYHTASMVYHYDKEINDSWVNWRNKNNFNKVPEDSMNYYNENFKISRD